MTGLARNLKGRSWLWRNRPHRKWRKKKESSRGRAPETVPRYLSNLRHGSVNSPRIHTSAIKWLQITLNVRKCVAWKLLRARGAVQKQMLFCNRRIMENYSYPAGAYTEIICYGLRVERGCASRLSGILLRLLFEKCRIPGLTLAFWESCYYYALLY